MNNNEFLKSVNDINSAIKINADAIIDQLNPLIRAIEKKDTKTAEAILNDLSNDPDFSKRIANNEFLLQFGISMRDSFFRDIERSEYSESKPLIDTKSTESSDNMLPKP